MARPGVFALLVFAVAVLAPSSATAQRPRRAAIQAGAVATLVLQVPAPDGVESLHYSLHLNDGYRPFIPTEGRIDRSGDLFVIPVTFATPARLQAGAQQAGRLQLVMDGHEPRWRDLTIQVRERREVAFHVDLEETTAPAGGFAYIPYRLYNRGNVVDTVRLSTARTEGWALLESPRLVLEPGDSAEGSLRLAAPASMTLGERQTFVVDASSAGGHESRVVNVVVVSPAGWLGGLAHVPSSFFLGQALGEAGGTVAALSGSGRIAPDTDMAIDFRYAEAGILDPALQREMAGARLRLAIERPELSVAVGDVYNPRSTLTGSFRQGRGIRASLDPAGPLSGSGYVAVPAGLSGETRGGHIVQAEGGLATRYGQFGVLAGDMVQPGLGAAPGTRSTGAGMRWKGALGVHSGSIEATLLRMTAGDTAQRTGPAVELDYRLDTDRVSGRVRARRVPGATTAAGGQGNELSASLSAELLPSLHAVGWAYGTEQAQLGLDTRRESFSANAGLRSRRGRLQLQLAGTATEQRTATTLDSFATGRTTVRGDAAFVLGALSLQSEVEIGTATEYDRRGRYQAIGSSVRWYSGGNSAWVRLQHARRPGGATPTTIQAGGGLRAGPVRFGGGLNHSMSGAVTTTSFWSSTDIDVRRNLAIQLGASARPSIGGDDWSFSLGVRRRLNLPLPISRQPEIHGVVFDDTNANGRLDPGERAMPGVILNLGYLETVTDGDGAFSFRDASGTALRVRSDRLPLGYVLSPAAILPVRGQASIPLLRTASLQLQLFLDRDGDGTRDAVDADAVGAAVVVADDHGRTRSATADADGAVRITGLIPGRYKVTARPVDARDRGGDPAVLLEVTLNPGAEVHHTVAVPLRQRTIRMQEGAGGFPINRQVDR